MKRLYVGAALDEQDAITRRQLMHIMRAMPPDPRPRFSRAVLVVMVGVVSLVVSYLLNR